jgi:hypothetical protein
MSDVDPILDLEALLDPLRLAVAWQIAHERPAAIMEVAGASTTAAEAAPEVEMSEDTAPVRATMRDAWPAGTASEGSMTSAESLEEPARAPLPIALAHRQLLDEIERTMAASPTLAARARRVLSVPLAQLAQLLVDDVAAEAALDQLEDVLQALLSEAGWPEATESAESEE